MGAPSSLLEPHGYAGLPGWAHDAHASAFAAFRRSAFQSLVKPYRTGSLGIAAESFAPAFAAARAADIGDDTAARAFFERWFDPHLVRPSGGDGFVTGFYEPEVEASPVRTDTFGVPLLAPPDDLVPIDDANRPANLDPYLAFARRDAAGHLVEYPDRAAIEAGALGHLERPIAWLRDPVDAFFVHVQGAARLNLSDGGVKRVTYAAKSGQRFTGPGHVLIAIGAMRREDVTMQSIRAWFRENPHRIDEILHQNRSYIFFREAPVEDQTLGPVAAAKVPLTAGRSIAVDRAFHTFATPVFVHAPTLSAFGSAPFARLMIAQDTGSAILGAARGDLFTGSGDAAGEIAGVVRHAADFFVLLPRREPAA